MTEVNPLNSILEEVLLATRLETAHMEAVEMECIEAILQSDLLIVIPWQW